MPTSSLGGCRGARRRRGPHPPLVVIRCAFLIHCCPLGYKATLSAPLLEPLQRQPSLRIPSERRPFWANPQIWKIFVKNPRFFVNTKDTSIFTIFMKITSFPCDWMILEDRFEHFPDTPSSKFSRIHGFGRFSYLLEPLQRQPSLRIPSGTWSFLLPFLRKKVHFREFRAHFRIIVFSRCAFVIHCCSILATKRPSARPFGTPSESVLNRDSFRNVVIFAPISAQKCAFSGIPCSFPNHSFHSVRIRDTLLLHLGYKATLSAPFWTPFGVRFE